jgi:hypothetical protein
MLAVYPFGWIHQKRPSQIGSESIKEFDFKLEANAQLYENGDGAALSLLAERHRVHVESFSMAKGA